MNTCRTPLFCFLLLITLTATGCSFGDRARDTFLVPALQTAWPGVSDDVQRGIDDAFEDGDLTQDQQETWTAGVEDFEAALDSGEREQLELFAPVWGSLRTFGDRGVQDRIDDGEISVGVAVSLTERLDNFTEAVNRVIDNLNTPD